MTKPPNLRMRALQKKHPELSEEDIKNTYANGVLEQYMNRPNTPSQEEEEEDGTIAPDFETMLYPDFHKYYQVKRYKDISKTQHKNKVYWRQQNQPEDSKYEGYDSDSGKPHPDTLWAVERIDRHGLPKPNPVLHDWRLPHLHGYATRGTHPIILFTPLLIFCSHHTSAGIVTSPYSTGIVTSSYQCSSCRRQYYYQKLLLCVPFRDNSIDKFYTIAENPRRSPRQECIIRGLIPDGDLASIVEADAKNRLFRPDEIAQFMNDLTDYEAVMNAVNEDDDSDETVDMSPEELSRLTTNLTYVHPAPPEAPVVMENADGITATWKEPSDDGTYVIEWDLKQKQYEFYKNMKDAGSKQICAFLSGEGGMGKSLIIRLLVRHWRSAGFNVIVCAASAKAATLVNGQTVHSAFKLNKDGKFRS